MIEFTAYPDGNVWSTEIPTVSVTTDITSKVVFTLYSGTTSGDVVFTNTFFAQNSVISVVGLGDIVAAYMRSKSQIFGTFSIKVADATGSQSASSSFCVCYCDRQMPVTVDDWATSRFLISADQVSMHGSDSLPLTALCLPTESTVKVNVVGTTAAETLTQQSVSYLIPSSLSSGFRVADVGPITVTSLTKMLEAKYITPIKNILSFVIILGNRHLQVFVKDNPEHSVAFRFKNMFNVQEPITLAGVTKRALDLTRNEAVVAGKSIQYDISGYRTYELTGAPMILSDAARVEYLVTSWSVTDESGRDILITSTDFSYDDDSTTTKSVTINWRYASQKVLDETALPTAAGIFSEPFSYQFS